MYGKKRVLLLGANGFVGQYVTKYLIKDFHVKALIRSAPKFGINSIFLKFVNGDATNQYALEKHLEGVDLVVSTIGPNRENPAYNYMKDYASKLIAAMSSKGVKRLIWVAGAGTLLGEDNQPVYTSPHFPANIKKIAEDHYHAYEDLMKSNLDVTVICPPVIVAGANEDKYKTFVDKWYGKMEVKVGHLAAFIKKLALEGGHSKQRVGIRDE